jgi:hypothetical protein
MEVDDKLLSQFKLSIGDFNGDDLDIYYKNQLKMAISDLITDDITEKQLDSELGRALTILYAEALMNKTDIATNPTITLLRNKVAMMFLEE